MIQGEGIHQANDAASGSGVRGGGPGRRPADGRDDPSPGGTAQATAMHEMELQAGLRAGHAYPSAAGTAVYESGHHGRELDVRPPRPLTVPTAHAFGDLKCAENSVPAGTGAGRPPRPLPGNLDMICISSGHLLHACLLYWK